VNQALAALLRGNNTTISIAHRLSTIKRSERVVVIGPDGRVAEQGSYRELAAREDGAFAQLMRWQLTGESGPVVVEPKKASPVPTEEEEIEYELEKDEEAEEAAPGARVAAAEEKER
jgi:putative ABC transport system ATP-binding protein